MTLLFQTTLEQAAKLPEIVQAMIKVGIDELLIAEANELAKDDQGVYELMELWLEIPEMDPERDECVKDIKQSIEDSKQPVGVWTLDIFDCDE